MSINSGIDWANLTKAPYQQGAELMQKSGQEIAELNERHNENVGEQMLKQQELGQQQQYNQGMLAHFGQQDITAAKSQAAQEQYLGSEAATHQQEVQQTGEFQRGQNAVAQGRLNLDGTVNMGELAMRQKAFGLAYQKQQLDMQDYLDARKAASTGGIDGWQIAQAKIGNWKAIQEYQQGQLDIQQKTLMNKKSAYDIMSSAVDAKTKQYGLQLWEDQRHLGGMYSAVAAMPEGPAKDAKLKELGDYADHVNGIDTSSFDPHVRARLAFVTAINGDNVLKGLLQNGLFNAQMAGSVITGDAAADRAQQWTKNYYGGNQSNPEQENINTAAVWDNMDKPTQGNVIKRVIAGQPWNQAVQAQAQQDVMANQNEALGKNPNKDNFDKTQQKLQDSAAALNQESLAMAQVSSEAATLPKGFENPGANQRFTAALQGAAARLGLVPPPATNEGAYQFSQQLLAKAGSFGLTGKFGAEVYKEVNDSVKNGTISQQKATQNLLQSSADISDAYLQFRQADYNAHGQTDNLRWTRTLKVHPLLNPDGTLSDYYKNEEFVRDLNNPQQANPDQLDNTQIINMYGSMAEKYGR